MAYKFQLGQSVLSGSVVFKEGLSANDASITNVNDIAVDTISADGSDMDIVLTDNQAAALEIKEGSNVYQKFVTTDGSEKIEFMKPMDFGNQAMTNVNIDSGAIELTAINIDGGTALGGATVAQADLLIIDDGAGGTNKSVTFSNFEDSIFGNISGDATIAAGGALTIAATAVEGSMLNNNIVSGLDDIGAAIAATDEMIISDAGTIKRTDVSRLGDFLGGTGLAVASGVLSLDGNEVGTGHAVSVPNDSFLFVDGGDNATKRDTFVNLAAGLAGGDGLTASGGLISVNVDDTGIEINSDAIRLKDNGVTLAKMAGLTRGSFIIGDSSGDPSALALGSAGQIGVSDGDDLVYRSLSGDVTMAANGAVTIANDAVEQAMIADDAVGADQLAANAVVDASVASGAAISLTKINTNVDMGGDFSIGNQADDTATFAGHVTVGGNLIVQGSTTTVDSTTINISSSFTFEGPADDHETTLHAGGDGTGDAPSADTTLYLPALSAGNYFIPVLADKATAASAAVTAAEFALLDGGSTVGTTALAAGDGFLHNDNGTMKQTQISKLGDFFASDGLKAVSGKLELDINGLGLSKTTLAQADIIGIVDSAGSDVSKKITFSNFEDQIFGNVSGDATIAAGGALTVAAGAIEHGMLNDNIISGQDALGGTGVAQADEFLFSDAGTVKKITFSNLEDAIFGNISGDAAILAGGALTIANDAVESGMLNDNVISGQTELASGGVVDADEMMISDGGVLKKVGVDSLKTYMQGQVVQNIDDSGTCVVGFNYFSNLGGAESCALPASPADGDIVYVKAPANASTTNTITVNRAGSQTIDGETAVVLESPFAAISLVYVGGDLWRIF